MRLFLLIGILATAFAFSAVPSVPNSLQQSGLRSSKDWESEDPYERSNLDKFLSTKYPAFYTLLSLDDDILKLLQDTKSITVFVPNQQAFDALEVKKLSQLADPRNLETVQKICAYHIIPDEVVPATRLFQEDWTVPKTKEGKPELSFRGVMTMGGEVAVSRSKSGGVLGLLKQDDGGVIIGPDAKIVKSFNVGTTAVVHEVNALVSPVLLWRFMDQLRIPGF
jgi:uncharacterized surface protein with fasciclin (FAS1) repeats